MSTIDQLSAAAQSAALDGDISDADWKNIKEKYAIDDSKNPDAKLGENGQTEVVDESSKKWQDFVTKIRDLVPPAADNASQAQLFDQMFTKELPNLAAQVQNLQTQLAAEKDPQQKMLLKAEIALAQGTLKGLLTSAKSMAPGLGKADDLNANPVWFEAAGMDPPTDGTNTATLTSKAMAGGGGQGTSASSAAKAQGFSAPPLWGAQTLGGGDMGFSSDAFMRSLSVDNTILNSLDSVLTNQNRGQQLMMLFYYFAQRAASGDMGQMYEFMKFLTYIISKDKAKQQIDMGQKLIELQDQSRQVTDVLMNANDNAQDPQASNDFMKTMTWAKSQSDSIATSQKLISQMMDEFATTVETLTNTTKTALDTYSRIMRRISSSQ